MTMLFAFVLMLLIVAAMALGVMMGRKPIAGSCGGAQALGFAGDCACGRTPGTCAGEGKGLEAIPHARNAAHALAEDAMAGGTGGKRTL